MLRFGRITVLVMSTALIGCDQTSQQTNRPAQGSGYSSGQEQSQSGSQPTNGNAGMAGVMQRAMDGDSFLFRSDVGEDYEIRMEGIDCPEKGQPMADVAKRWLETVTRGRTIWMIPTGKDRYGRTLANVHNGDIWINGESIRLGLAWHYESFNRDGRLARLQMDAQAARVGVWQSGSPMPPWEFRKLNSRR